MRHYYQSQQTISLRRPRWREYLLKREADKATIRRAVREIEKEKDVGIGRR